ncbi:YopX family protein [Peribacillus muralis]|uniref:YopX family protein n=1 Tax=Peribacillus muralis TaxID=264697 RepID=UPI003D02A8F6
MREIKFRAWNGEMTYINDWHWYEANGVHDVEGGLAYGGYAVYTLMQYTGLKDKNGVEIYEGDIIVYEIDNGVGIESYCARVFWSENEDEYKNRLEWLIDYIDINGFDALSRPAVYNEGLQVIGNIHENPELLES